MKLLSAIAVLFITVGVCLEPYPADAAGKYDGAVPFLCVPTAVAECVAEGECRPGTAESENLPDFFKIDLKAKTVRAEEKGGVAYRAIDRGDGEIILYGSGRTLLGPDDPGEDREDVGGRHGGRRGFAIFGICPPPTSNSIPSHLVVTRCFNGRLAADAAFLRQGTVACLNGS